MRINILKRWSQIFHQVSSTLRSLSIPLQLFTCIITVAKYDHQLRLDKIEIIVKGGIKDYSSASMIRQIKDPWVWDFFRAMLGYPGKLGSQDRKEGRIEFHFEDSQQCSSLDALRIFCEKSSLPVIITGQAKMCYEGAFETRKSVSMKG